MKLPKPDPKALKTFQALVPAGPTIKVKPMFGNFGAFANGKMFMGVFGEHVFVKLEEKDRAEALALPGANVFAPMAGRPMKEYVVLPPAVLADRARSGAWVQKSLAYVGRIPKKNPPTGVPRPSDAALPISGRARCELTSLRASTFVAARRAAGASRSGPLRS